MVTQLLKKVTAHGKNIFVTANIMTEYKPIPPAPLLIRRGTGWHSGFKR